MHPIEQNINLFLEAVCEGKASFTEEQVQEFGERCKQVLRKQFLEKPSTEKKFFLRMSSIGRPLRQLMLEKASGGRGKPSKEFKLKATIGHIYEAFFLQLLKASGCKVDNHDGQVKLDVAGIEIPGTYDVKIAGKIYDIKTASSYAYEYKFRSLDDLINGDSFGYLAQGFGYAMADKVPFGGYIAINKETGDFKVLSIPVERHNELCNTYNKEITYKVKYILSGKDMPPCDGIVNETFMGKETGNRVLSRECEWCNYKDTCHKNLQQLPEAFSKAKTRKLKYYIGEVKKPNETKTN